MTISSNVKILAYDASMGYYTNDACKIGIVEIGSNVFIGHGTTILCNTKIGDNVLIGAGSVVSIDVPSGTVFAGNSAKLIKTIDEFRKQYLSNIQSHPTFTKPWKEFKKTNTQ